MEKNLEGVDKGHDINESLYHTDSDALLRAELNAISYDVKQRIIRDGFNEEEFLIAARHIVAEIGSRASYEERATARYERNRARGRIERMKMEDVTKLPKATARLSEIGLDAIMRGKVALCIAAGGNATRMGCTVKALHPLPSGRTFLDHRINEAEEWFTRGARVPLWLGVSPLTSQPISRAISSRSTGAMIEIFSQGISLRITEDGKIFRDAAGELSAVPRGHGDLIPALQESSVLNDFIDSGGEWVMIANVDNLAATLEPKIIGKAVETGCECLVEVVERRHGDKGGAPAWVDGRPVLLEEFRCPVGWHDLSPVFNTNTFVVKASKLASLREKGRLYEVEKCIGDEKVIQFERIIGEITNFLQTTYLMVPRDGETSRFVPMKSIEDILAHGTSLENIVSLRLLAR